MDVIQRWTGRTACALQTALRLTNEQFAARLGVAPRTVAKWHAAPDSVPRLEMQQILDTAYETAGEQVRRRFGLLTAPPPTTGQTTAQALRVAVAVVTRRGEVLLVCRRGDGHLLWQFPAGVVKPGAQPAAVAVQETHAETGVHCAIRKRLGTRLHPLTGVLCDYLICDYLTGEPTNRDPLENVDVAWVPIGQLGRFIPPDRIYPPITAALEAAV